MAINRQFLVFTFGVFLQYTGINGVLVLVSSINIEDGLGTTSLAVAYASSITAAFIVPMLIERLGCRIVIAVAELGYLLFVIANVCKSYNIVLGGFLYGVGEAGVWTAYPIVSSRFASTHSNSGSKSEETYKNHYIGYLFTSVQASLIFGSVAGFAILSVDRSLSSSLNHTVDYSVCGANDCQDTNITMANLDLYTPAYQSTRYIVIGIFSFVIICAMSLHLIYLPDDRPTYTRKSCDADRTEDNSDEMNQISTKEQSRLRSNDDECSGDATFAKDSSESENVIVFHEDKQKIHGCFHLKTTVLSSAKLFIEPKQLLVMLLPIYNGLVIGFVLSEVTRAYASCVLGLDKVGIGSIIFGTADALLSFIAGRVAGKYGRNIPYAFAFLLDVSIYVFCLCWVITPNTAWMVYVVFFAFGVTDGIWQTLINVMYAEYFMDRSEIAINLWNVLVNIGTLTQFAISTSFCVYQKIYLQMSVLCLAVLTYGVSQYIYYHPRKAVASADSLAKPEEIN